MLSYPQEVTASKYENEESKRSRYKYLELVLETSLSNFKKIHKLMVWSKIQV